MEFRDTWCELPQTQARVILASGPFPEREEPPTPRTHSKHVFCLLELKWLASHLTGDDGGDRMKLRGTVTSVQKKLALENFALLIYP